MVAGVDGQEHGDRRDDGAREAEDEVAGEGGHDHDRPGIRATAARCPLLPACLLDRSRSPKGIARCLSGRLISRRSLELRASYALPEPLEPGALTPGTPSRSAVDPIRAEDSRADVCVRVRSGAHRCE